jgi:uncharacterized protein
MAYIAHTIYVSCDCNFRCSYCYINNKKPIFVSKTEAEDVANRIYNIGSDKAIIEYFGGEPLLNWESIRYFLELLNTEQSFHTLVTNGFLLDKRKIAELKRHKVHVRISYDGKRGHDKCRRTVEGEKTEKKIRNQIDLSIQKGLDFGINYAVHRLNAPTILDDIDDLIYMGINNIWLYPVNRSGYSIGNFQEINTYIKERYDLDRITIGTGSQDLIEKRYVHTGNWYKRVLPAGNNWENEKWP